jgi:hypothetical protein
MNDPITIPTMGAIHQNRACVNTSFTPAHWVASPVVCECFGVSGILTQMYTRRRVGRNRERDENRPPRRVAQRPVRAASSRRAPRCLPLPSSSRQATPGLATGYQLTIAFIGAIRHAAHPAPISARANDEAGYVVGDGKEKRPRARDHQQHRLDAPRTVPVEQHAGGKLHGGECEESRHSSTRPSDAGHQPELAA